MKKLITTLLLIASISGYAQITLENTYPTGSSYYKNLRLVKLSSSGYKYITSDDSTLILYNLNHTVFRIINIPQIAGGYYSCWAYYVSEELFNTNPADIEYFLYYSNGTVFNCRVFDELGTVLLAKDSIGGNMANLYGKENFISYTTTGCKMIISNFFTFALPNYEAYVYALPGFLPCQDCTGGVITGMTTESGNLKSGNITNYPNPNNGQTTIEYTLPQGTTTADLVFYNMTGQEIKRFKVTDTFHDIVISTADLEAGTYYYQLQTTSGFKAGKKMVVIK